MDEQLRDGSALLSFMWFNIAKRVVEKAAIIYELNEDQVAALRKVFLRPNDYTVEIS
jgi:hypothetical protein